MCREELIDFDKYIFSKDGKIYSKHFKKALDGWVDKDGYLVNCLTLKNGKRQPYRVNRVIAYLFVPKPEHLKDIPYEELQVGHDDTNRTNNNSCNLYWCTSKENNNNLLTKEKQRKYWKGKNNHMFGRHLDDNAKEKLSEINSIPILQYTKEGVLVGEWKSTKSASKELGINAANITACLKNYPFHKSAGGYKWSYKNEN